MENSVIFEFRQIGPYVKVIAVDTQTGTEISLSVPNNLSQEQMQSHALKRLRYVLSKTSKKNDSY